MYLLKILVVILPSFTYATTPTTPGSDSPYLNAGSVKNEPNKTDAQEKQQNVTGNENDEQDPNVPQASSEVTSKDNGMRQHMDALNSVMWHEDQFDKFLAETEHKMRLVAFSFVSAASRVELMNAYSNLASLVVQHLATIMDDSAKADSHMDTAVKHLETLMEVPATVPEFNHK